MAEYIEREAAIEAVCMTVLHAGVQDALKSCINDIPAADVKPVVRGEWVLIDGAPHCNCCGLLPEHVSKYCPNCGADMRPPKEE